MRRRYWKISFFPDEFSRLRLLYFLLPSAVEFEVMVTSFGVEPISKEAFRGRIVGKSSVAAKTVRLIRAGGKKGPIRDHFGKEAFFSIASTLVLFGLLLTSAESRDGSPLTTLSSGIVRTQVPLCPPATLIKLMQLIAPAAVVLVVVLSLMVHNSKRLADVRRCPGSFFLVFQWTCGLEREAQGARWGSWDAHRQTLRQPVCKGMLVLLPSPSTSLDFYYIAHLI